MENPVFSANTIPPEGTSQIFVTPPGGAGGGFHEIFVDQRSLPADTAPGKGSDLQAGGNDAPTQPADVNDTTRADDEWEPTFVTPPNEEAATDEAEAQPIFVETPGFQGEAYPVSALYSSDALEVHTLTDEDLAEPVLIEPDIGTTVNTSTTQSVEQAPIGIDELTQLATGDYADEIVQTGAARVEVAALDTRPFSQPLATEAAVADDAATPRPATSGVTTTTATAATGQPADPGVVPATSSGTLQAAVRDAVKSEQPPVVEAEATGDGADVVPATSSGTLNSERLAELRQIQAYADNTTARANDGSNGRSDTIDIAALNTRLDRAHAPAPSQHAPMQNTPHALNFTEKGWEQSFGQNIHWMSANNIKSAQIRINPAELGPVRIDLTMQKDQLTLQINATHQITRDTLEAALPRLRAELAEQGFSNAHIGMGQPGGEQRGGHHEATQEGDAVPQAAPADDGDDAVEIVPATSAANLMSGSVSLLDTFA